MVGGLWLFNKIIFFVFGHYDGRDDDHDDDHDAHDDDDDHDDEHDDDHDDDDDHDHDEDPPAIRFTMPRGAKTPMSSKQAKPSF